MMIMIMQIHVWIPGEQTLNLNWTTATSFAPLHVTFVSRVAGQPLAQRTQWRNTSHVVEL